MLCVEVQDKMRAFIMQTGDLIIYLIYFKEDKLMTHEQNMLFNFQIV